MRNDSDQTLSDKLKLYMLAGHKLLEPNTHVTCYLLLLSLNNLNAFCFALCQNMSRSTSFYSYPPKIYSFFTFFM